MTAQDIKSIAARSGKRAVQAGARHEAVARARTAGKRATGGLLSVVRASLCALLALPVIEAGTQETIDFLKTYRCKGAWIR